MGAVSGGAAAIKLAALYACGAKALFVVHDDSSDFWGAASSTACQCLNWQQTYDAKLVKCGQGFEFAPLTYPNYAAAPEAHLTSSSKMVAETHPDVLYGDGVCKAFEMFDGSECVRTTTDRAEGEWFGGSWCYVSKGCKRAFDVPDSRVRAKLCVQGQDALLSHVTPAELLDIGERIGVPTPAYLLKMAYPVERSWSWADRYNHSESYKAIRDAQKPWILKDRGDESLMIVQGRQVWEFSGDYSSFRCAEGCSKGETTALAVSERSVILPAGNVLCMEGDTAYMSRVLARLQASPMAPGWRYSSALAGSCDAWGYTHGAPDSCFENVTAYYDDVMDHLSHVNSHSIEFMMTHLMRSGQTMEEVQMGMGEVCDK